VSAITQVGLFDFDFIFFLLVGKNVGTPARAALRLLLRVGLGRHGRECVVSGVLPASSIAFTVKPKFWLINQPQIAQPSSKPPANPMIKTMSHQNLATGGLLFSPLPVFEEDSCSVIFNSNF